MPTGQQYASTAPQTNLVGGINNSQTNSITVASFTGWPATPFSGTFEIGTASQEVIDVLTVSGNTITSCTRGVDGTSASSHGNNATFTHAAIGRDFREMRAHIDASASNDSTGHAVHGLTTGSSVVGTTDVQTLTNKTLTSPTITGMNSANPNITGTVTGAAQYQNIIAGTAAVGSIPLVAKGLANQTADLFDVQNSAGTPLFSVSANGATGAGATTVAPTDTGNTSLTVKSPNTSTWPLQVFTGSTELLRVDGQGVASLLNGPLKVSGITGAVTSSRYVGGTNGAPPSTGTFLTGDWAIETKYGGVWVNTAGGSPGNWEGAGEMLLAQTTLGAPAASVTFSSIPGGFTNLHLVTMARSSGSNANAVTDLRMQFNSDTGTNYGHQFIFMLNNSTVSGSTLTSATNCAAGFVTNTSAGGATMGGTSDVYIPYYANTNWLKRYVFQSQSGAITAAWQTGSGGGVWNATSAITSITLFLADGSNFTANSTFQLFGRP